MMPVPSFSHQAGGPGSPTTSIDRLRAGIWDIHEGVASGPIRGGEPSEDIMKGTLPIHKYTYNLAQRYLLQAAFEEVLRENLAEGFVASVVTEEQYHAPKAEADLRFFGIDPSGVAPLEATRRLIAFFRETANKDPRLVIAIHYVIEGSNNGGIHIARAVKAAYGLEGTNGTLHLQPYGPAVREKWAQFRDAFNALPIDEELMREMIVVGRTTFGLMNAVTQEAYAKAPK